MHPAAVRTSPHHVSDLKLGRRPIFIPHPVSAGIYRHGVFLRDREILRIRCEHIIIVGHLHTIEQHHIFQFRGIAHHRLFSDNGIAADERTVTHFRFLVDDGGMWKWAATAF